MCPLARVTYEHETGHLGLENSRALGRAACRTRRQAEGWMPEPPARR